MKRVAFIKKVDGVVISDPSYYGKDVWCRYESNIKCKDWKMDFESCLKEDECEGYRFTYVDFKLKVGFDIILDNIKIKDDSVFYPKGLEVKEYQICMDTACFCCGSKKNFDLFGETISVHTGTDGMLGSVYEFTMKGSELPVAILFTGSVDADLVTEQSLYDTFCAGFDAIK